MCQKYKVSDVKKKKKQTAQFKSNHKMLNIYVFSHISSGE